MRKIHISDSNAKNTFVHFTPIKLPPYPVRAYGKQKVFSKRLILSGENNDYENLLLQYQQKLPEILLNEDFVSNEGVTLTFPKPPRQISEIFIPASILP